VSSNGDLLWQLLRGALGTRALALVAEHDVAGALADGPRPVEELAPKVGADAETLRRLLRALASDGFFVETESGVFANTPASELLLEPGWTGFAQLFGGVWLRATADLQADGRPAWEHVFGADFWSWLAAHQNERALFDTAMEQGNDWRVDRLDVVEWRGDETVVDVGGGNGSLLQELIRKRPTLRGIVFDLPETVRDEPALGERIEFVEGSFFERVPEGDVHVLSTILHDWDDERAGAILQSVRAAARGGARLLILDAVLPDGNEPSGAKWLDLLMLTLFGGKERSEAQWRELLAIGGFEPVRFHEALIEARAV
jgi:hypothetical protein